MCVVSSIIAYFIDKVNKENQNWQKIKVDRLFVKINKNNIAKVRTIVKEKD